MTKLNIGKYITLILLGMFLLAIRHTTPLIIPSVYAEDGTWIAHALSRGWMDTFIHAREDYFVFFNIFFLFVSTFISDVLSGSPLLLLPQSIAVVSYFFYSLISVIAFHTIIKISTPLFAILAYFLILFLPLGQSQSENIGHLLQIGFYMPAIAILLILQRDNFTDKTARTIVDLLIWLTAATNPVVFIIVGIYYSFIFLITKDKLNLVKDLLPLTISMIILAISILPRINGSGGLGDYGYNPENIIEMGTARLILYPFVFPWYENLNDKTSIILTLLYALFCLAIIYKTKDIRAKKYLIAIAMALTVSITTTILGRIGLSDLLNNYQTTFPDRYFSGTNYISILLFIACLSQCNFSKPIRYSSYILCIVLSCIYISNLDKIVQDQDSKRNITFNNYFSFAICNSNKIDDSYSAIQIQPVGWTMTIPTYLLSQISCH